MTGDFTIWHQMATIAGMEPLVPMQPAGPVAAQPGPMPLPSPGTVLTAGGAGMIGAPGQYGPYQSFMPGPWGMVRLRPDGSNALGVLEAGWARAEYEHAVMKNTPVPSFPRRTPEATTPNGKAPSKPADPNAAPKFRLPSDLRRAQDYVAAEGDLDRAVGKMAKRIAKRTGKPVTDQHVRAKLGKEDKGNEREKFLAGMAKYVTELPVGNTSGAHKSRERLLAAHQALEAEIAAGRVPAAEIPLRRLVALLGRTNKYHNGKFTDELGEGTFSSNAGGIVSDWGPISTKDEQPPRLVEIMQEYFGEDWEEILDYYYDEAIAGTEAITPYPAPLTEATLYQKLVTEKQYLPTFAQIVARELMTIPEAERAARFDQIRPLDEVLRKSANETEAVLQQIVVDTLRAVYDYSEAQLNARWSACAYRKRVGDKLETDVPADLASPANVAVMDVALQVFFKRVRDYNGWPEHLRDTSVQQQFQQEDFKRR